MFGEKHNFFRRKQNFNRIQKFPFWVYIQKTQSPHEKKCSAIFIAFFTVEKRCELLMCYWLIKEASCYLTISMHVAYAYNKILIRKETHVTMDKTWVYYAKINNKLQKDILCNSTYLMNIESQIIEKENVPWWLS